MVIPTVGYAYIDINDSIYQCRVALLSGYYRLGDEKLMEKISFYIHGYGMIKSLLHKGMTIA